MSDTLTAGRVAHLLAAAHGILDELAAADLTGDSDEALLDALRSVETLRRRLDYADYRVIAEAASRHLPEVRGHASMSRMLAFELRLDRGEAGARARAAGNAVGLRAPSSGEQLPAPYAQVAAAQACGVVSQKQALIVASTIDKLPGQVQADLGEQIEGELVGYAQTFDATSLAKIGAHLRDLYDPDGTAPDLERQQRRRDLQITTRPDGSCRITGEGTVELTELLLTTLDTLAAPAPEADGVKDTRTPGQRNHDALVSALDMLLRCGDIPDHNGVSTTVIVTLTTDQYLTGCGLARTGHGFPVPTAEALRWGAGDCEVLAVALNSLREITHYGTAHRIHTKNQRHAMTARDRGCTAPGCPEPPSRCQAHHVIDHARGGPTSVANGALACRWHHRHLIDTGWHTTMINGRPHWVPPATLDRTQRPRRNTLHDHPAA